MANKSAVFELFVTSVEREGPLLKIWGQIDQTSMMFIEQMLLQLSADFDEGRYVPNIASLRIGQICFGKYLDGVYYRAKIKDLSRVREGMVIVYFIDHGNVEALPLTSIRVMENVHSSPLGSLIPLANDYILAGSAHINNNWDDKSLHIVTSMICNYELKVIIVALVGPFKLIRIEYKDKDLSELLIQMGMAVPISVSTQELMLNQKLHSEPKFPQIPQHIPPPVSVPQVPVMSPFKPNLYSQMMPPAAPTFRSPTVSTSSVGSGEPDKGPSEFKSTILPTNSEHTVSVSSVEDGPKVFSVQLQAWEKSLTKIMNDINNIEKVPMTDLPLPGTQCLARCHEQNVLCRAVITHVLDQKIKVYFVDFGHTSILEYSDVFNLPREYLSVRILALRFCLAGLKTVNVTSELKQIFKNYVKGKLLKLKVAVAEGPPIVQYCELYDNQGKNVMDLIKKIHDTEFLKYQPMKPLETDCIADVLISYVNACREFYVHLLFNADSLTKLMSDVAKHCATANNVPTEYIKVGLPCCAFFQEDEQWYRAQVLMIDGNNIKVRYVDYGNESVVVVNNLKPITSELVNRLHPQAIKCCLDGYQDIPDNEMLSNTFESLVLEQKFTMKILKYYNDSLLVDLLDSSHVAITKQLSTPIEPISSPKQPDVLIKNPVEAEISPIPDKRAEKKSFWGKNADKPPSSDDSFENTSPPKYHKARNEYNSTDKSKFQRDNFDSGKSSWRNSDRNDSNKNFRSSNSRTNSKGSWHNSKPDSWSNTKSEGFGNPKSEGSGNAKSEGWNNTKPDSWSNTKSEGFGNPKSEGSGNAKSEGWNNTKSEGWSNTKSDNWKNKNVDSYEKKDFGKHNKGDGYSSDRSHYSDKSAEKPKWQKQTFDYAPFDQQYSELTIVEGMIETVSVAWFYNPKHFYCLVKSSENEFHSMMGNIQKSYKNRDTITENLSVGASVIARFLEDNVLYRATVIDYRPPKYKIQYVDFGNICYVGKNQIWPIEKRFMDLPKQSIVCSLSGIFPVGEKWNDTCEMDNCFNKGDFQCVFYGREENRHVVDLSYNGLRVVDDLINKGLAVNESCVDKPLETSQQIPGIENDLDDVPVDLELLPGQTMRVHISFVYGLERFFIYIDNDKAQNVLKSINEFMGAVDISTVEKLSPEQLVVGAVCLVHIEESWHRAIITDIAATSGIFVEFPDLGGGDELSADDMYVLPMELAVFYYQAVECGVYNYSVDCNENITDEEFKNKIEEQDVIVYFNDLSNGRLYVTIYDIHGKKLIPAIESVEDINPVCPMSVTSSHNKVWVSHINSINSIYIQKCSDTDKIALFLDKLYNFYEEKEPSEEFEVAVNKTYAVKSICDGNWYRGQVIDVTSDKIQVVYIDYGNQEVVGKDAVRTLDESFYMPSEFALHIALPVRVIEEVNCVTVLNELTQDKEFTTNLAFTEGCWYAELYENDIALSGILLEKKLVALLDFDPFKRKSIDVTDSKIVLRITHVDSPNQFYAQLANDEASIEKLQDDISNDLDKLAALENPDTGVLCAAQYSADGVWYRAEVLDADEHITTVRFIDYGNTDVLDNSSGVIKELPKHLLTIDRHAKKCSLNVSPVGEDWNQTACELFEKKVVELIVLAEILYQDEKGTIFVNLYAEDVNISEWIINEGYGTANIQKSDTAVSNNTGFVSHINSINEFWIQFESSCSDLELMSDLLANAEGFPDLVDKHPGVLCAAKFPEDEMWYRARIITVSDESTDVLFIDYGNSSKTTELKALPEEVVNFRSLALKCMLQKPADLNEWPDNANDKLCEISADGATIFTVKVISTGETSNVELSYNGVNILDEILPKSEAELNIENVIITQIESPDLFYVQLESQTLDLDNIIEVLMDSESLSIPDEILPNKLYAATFEDGMWYRAKILENENGNFKVFFVDYGNMADTQEIRELDPEIVALPPLAKQCKLELPKNVETWCNLATEKFSEIVSEVAENSDTFQMIILNDGDPALVKLFLDTRNISEEIISEVTDEILKDFRKNEIDNILEAIMPSENNDENLKDSKTNESDKISEEIISSKTINDNLKTNETVNISEEIISSETTEENLKDFRKNEIDNILEAVMPSESIDENLKYSKTNESDKILEEIISMEATDERTNVIDNILEAIMPSESNDENLKDLKTNEFDKISEKIISSEATDERTNVIDNILEAIMPSESNDETLKTNESDKISEEITFSDTTDENLKDLRTNVIDDILEAIMPSESNENLQKDSEKQTVTEKKELDVKEIECDITTIKNTEIEQKSHESVGNNKTDNKDMTEKIKASIGLESNLTNDVSTNQPDSTNNVKITTPEELKSDETVTNSKILNMKEPIESEITPAKDDNDLEIKIKSSEKEKEDSDVNEKCVDNLDEIIEKSEEESDENIYVSIQRRSSTPHDEKIVPGAICRGD